MAIKLLRRPEVKARTGANDAIIYEGMRDGTFPKCVPIGRRTVGWLESEIDDWIKGKIAARDRGEGPRNAGGPGRGHRVRAGSSPGEGGTADAAS